MDILIFWCTAASIVYAYAGFPVLVACMGWLRNRQVHKKDITPKVSFIIAAHNEAEVIAGKIENTLALDYPSTELEIIVASDGSTDETNSIAERYVAKGITLLRLPRAGKISAMDQAIVESSGEILVFTDANTMLASNALQALVRNFADNSVGGVCGDQGHMDISGNDTSGEGERLFWRYDRWLKRLQSSTGNIVSADGALYAIRASLYQRPAVADVTDDFVISTGVIEQGFRLVYEPEALASEPVSSNAQTEFSRKVRIISSGLRAVFLRRALLNPFRFGFYSVVLFSHKILRRLVPLLLVLLFVVSASLSNESLFYCSAAISQVAFYCLAAAGYFLRHSWLGRWKIFYIPFFYCLANSAALIALVRLFSGERVQLWEPVR